MTPQQTFDAKYITATEIMETLGIARSTLLVARRNGKLPNPILIAGQIYIWERDKVRDYLAAWKLMLDTRRGWTA